jgi:hypothetical protein
MAILQALLALIGRSAGKILNAIFGWAVRALFGATPGAQQTLLTALVGAAALWPLLVVGIAAPRVGAFLLAFVPISKSIPDGAIRLVWIALALVVPGLVGIALAIEAPRTPDGASALTRAARGYRVTLGISAAFWLSFVVVPLLQLRSAIRGHQQTYVPLIIGREGYEQTAARIQRVLEARGFGVTRRSPTFWMRAPFEWMRAIAGDAVDRFAPTDIAYLVGPELEIILYPSSLLLRGALRRTTVCHGLIVEALARTDACETTDAAAQSIERQIRRVWAVLDRSPAAHTNSRWLLQRLREIAEEVAELDVAYDEWQIVYRQTLQLGRALSGEPPLLTRMGEEEEMKIQDSRIEREATRSHGPAAADHLSTPELIREIGAKSMLLARTELDLAKQEMKEDVRAEIAAIKAFAAAIVAGIATVNLLLVAAVFALIPYSTPVHAALAVAGIVLLLTVVAAGIAWQKRVKEPLDLTRKTVEEDVQFAKEQMA